MAWTKIPKENHPLFYEALPLDPRVETVVMFGGVCGKVNNNMFGGLWGNSAVVRLSEEDRAQALELEGTEVFDPMGRGNFLRMVVLPEEVFADPAQLTAWIARAIEFTATLPPKPKKAKKKKAKKKKAKKKKAKKKKAKKKKAKKKKAKKKKAKKKKA